MSIRVNYTQRGFRNKEEYELFGGRTDTEDYNPLKLTHTNVRCKNPDCLVTNTTDYTIEHVENRDLETNPIICGSCGGKNVRIDYFKPNKLPLIYVDENHANANMYNDVLKKWEKGLIHPNFESIIQKLRSPYFYYGSEGKAQYVDPDEPMMDGSIKNPEGFVRDWNEYPWVDINLTIYPPINNPDPVLFITPLSPLLPIPDSDWLNNNLAKDNDGNDIPNRVHMPVFTSYYANELKIATHETFVPEGQTQTYHNVTIKKGSIWDWDIAYSSAQKETILLWEQETGNVHPRKNKKFPSTDILVFDRISQSVWTNTRTNQIAMSVGQYFIGEDGVDIKLYSTEENCDCINENPSRKLPGVDPILFQEIDLPPLPLFIDPSLGSGSENTGYTQNDINRIKSDYSWIISENLITEIESKEGSLYNRITIPAADHRLINIIDQQPGCPPCVKSNNMMYSAVLYITTQVDLDNPIY